MTTTTTAAPTNPVGAAIHNMVAAFAAIATAKGAVKAANAVAARAAAQGHKIRGFSWEAAAAALPGSIKKDSARMWGYAGLALLQFSSEFQNDEQAGAYADRLRRRLSTKVSTAHLPVGQFTDWLYMESMDAKALFSLVDGWVDPDAAPPLTDKERLTLFVGELTNDGTLSDADLASLIAIVNS